jgi:hypothetical protein
LVVVQVLWEAEAEVVSHLMASTEDQEAEEVHLVEQAVLLSFPLSVITAATLERTQILTQQAAVAVVRVLLAVMAAAAQVALVVLECQTA